jgi:hypothetical protein
MGQKILGGDFLEGLMLGGKTFERVPISAARSWGSPTTDHPKIKFSDCRFQIHFYYVRSDRNFEGILRRRAQSVKKKVPGIFIQGVMGGKGLAKAA